MSVESMRRGAREANAQSDRNAEARRLGEALGTIAGTVMEIQGLRERISKLEAAVAALSGEPK
jgi:polyhydroxyalkanoate synthesis regulator phasin